MELHQLIESRITEWTKGLPQGNLYAPMAYLMGLPAKRVRPMLVLMACELFGGKADEALDEALGIELFHNFTLMHDDIMDRSPLRRGHATVHEKWDVNTAILSGDALLVMAHQAMGRRTDVSGLFNRFALMVCEGQQLDMDHERRTDVDAVGYMEMIRLKTAVLLSCALQTGALIGGADARGRELIGAFGEHMGLAFQLQDDLLDAFGDPQRTGKQQGGDLRADKKTFLLIRGMELSTRPEAGVLHQEMARPAPERDIPRILNALEACGARKATEEAIHDQERKASTALDAIAVPEERKAPLRNLALALAHRNR